MTFSEAENQLENSPYRVGEHFQYRVANDRGYGIIHYLIEEIIISPPDNWREVRRAKYLAGGDNKKALKDLGFPDKELEVVFINEPNGNPKIQTLTDQLKLIAL